jgi:hypothetical protein
MNVTDAKKVRLIALCIKYCEQFVLFLEFECNSEIYYSGVPYNQQPQRAVQSGREEREARIKSNGTYILLKDL